jgi:hypothetical protein
VAKTDFEKRAEQIRSQIEDLRESIGDWLATAQAQMARSTRQARRGLRETGEEISEAGIPWWVPVAVVGVIGIAIALANMMGMFGMREGGVAREHLAGNVAGGTPPYGMPGQS